MIRRDAPRAVPPAPRRRTRQILQGFCTCYEAALDQLPVPAQPFTHRAYAQPATCLSQMALDNSGKGILLKADPIAAAFRDEIKAGIAQSPRAPKLVGILATSAAPSKFYAEFTKKQCDDLGVEFVLKKIGAAADPALAEGEGVEEAIIEANNDESVDGIMVCATYKSCTPSSVSMTNARCITPSLECSRLVACPALVRLCSAEAVLAGSLPPASKLLHVRAMPLVRLRPRVQRSCPP